MKIWRLGPVVLALVFMFSAIGFYFSSSGQRLIYPLRFQEPLMQAAREFDIPPSLLAAVVYTESKFEPNSRSDAGAVGLMQLMPDTANWLAKKLDWEIDLSSEDLTDPSISLRLGSFYLSWLIKRFDGDLVKALAAYNIGQHEVDKWLASKDTPLLKEDIPYGETRFFVTTVLKAQDSYIRLYPKYCSNI